MAHITAVHLGLIFFLTCLTTQVVSQSTLSPNMTAANHTVSHVNSTMATNRTTTTPAGAAYQLQSSSVFVLISGTISTILIHHRC
ncbi:hypothetical protein KOW79_016012 [Hemibagrus wyckioides]|uniref:Uncharacterized protein n=1 Tax=Hemibagrus wyckioides TaxID=337641 RepID=A0A9D3NEQ6_9TELE|nr:hypothetical protein KOW79_016012 [Hemibagrus wyckioides]